MGALPRLRRKNAAAAAEKNGAAELSTLLPQVQAGAHRQRTEFQIEIIDQPDAKTQC